MKRPMVSRQLVFISAVFCVVTMTVSAACADDSKASNISLGATVAASLSGTVVTASGVSVMGASVSARGPVKVRTTSDVYGHFLLTVAPGVYDVEVSKGGFNQASLRDIAVVAGQSQPLAVTLSAADLRALRTIGTVTSSGGGAISINTSAATVSHVSGQRFADLANPQINSVLQRLPDVTVQYLGANPETSIIVGGAQPYETQILIDGHPMALGKSGVWVSTYFPSYLIGGVETQSGPGNTTPFANLAVGGTANLLTPGFTNRPRTELVMGTDSYRSQYSNLLTTGSVGRLSYVLGAGTGASNGPFFKKTECSVSADNFQNDNTAASTGTVQFCGDASSSLFTRGSVAKVRYDLTPSTSFDAGFVGAWAGFLGQAASYADTIGPTKVVSCLSPPLQLQCTNPAYAGLIGKTVNGTFFYPGTVVSNNQTLFDGQFRTSIGSNTLLVRPYIGSIEPEEVVGSYQNFYPNFFSPPGADPTAFANFCSANFGSPTSRSGAIVSINGQQECFQTGYIKYEQDKLYGTTFSLIHPFGESNVNLTYDFHGQSTFGYELTPSNVTVPFSAVRYSTLSLTADLHVIRDIGIGLGLYSTNWTLAGTQPELRGGSPVLDANGNTVAIGLGRAVARFDPHFALVYRPSGDLAYRLAYGTSTTFPYIGQVSGLASYGPFSPNVPQYTGGNLVEENPSLAPETSIAYGLGVDKRFKESILSLDLTDTVIHDVFETLTQGVPTSIGQLLAVSRPINAARLRSELATIKFDHAPLHGFGYNVAVAAQRSIVDGIPAALYQGGPGFPVNNVQVCGNGLDQPGIPTCIPYVKGYAQATYAWRRGGYAGLGIDYQGKNNPYYQPPFAVLDLTVRHPIAKTLDFQLSVQNLLNTNVFSSLAAPNLGVPLVAGATNDGLTAYQTTYLSTLIPAPARNVRAQLRYHF